MAVGSLRAPTLFAIADRTFPVNGGPMIDGSGSVSGDKPLFYSLTDGAPRFGSELNALMADPAFPRRIEPAALDCYLAMGFVSGDLCILKGVKKLRPRHALVLHIASGESRLWRYWDLPTECIGGVKPGGRACILEELETLLEDASCPVSSLPT